MICASEKDKMALFIALAAFVSLANMFVSCLFSVRIASMDQVRALAFILYDRRYI